MTRRVLVLTLLLIATVFSTTAFAAVNDCSGGATLKFVGVGSSAMFNSFAYAAVNVVSGGTLNTNSYSLISNSGPILSDTRFTTALNDSATLWVVWSNNDGSNKCNVYADYSVDSTVGVKDFYAYKKVADQANDGTLFSVSAINSVFTSLASGNKVNGLVDNLQGLTSLPATIVTALTTPPIPLSKTDTPHAHGLDYCGYKSGGSVKAGVWCYFNAGLTDIRPEDALYATTRALTTIPAAGGVTGLGYNNPTCLAGTAGGGTAAQQGCPILESFAQNKYFNPLTFKITGTDPITLGAIPASATLPVGASPIVVFVANKDTSNALGFGKTYTDNSSVSHYIHTDINKKVLSLVFDGTLHCTGDLLPGTPGAGNNVYDSGNLAGPPPGHGAPIQVVQREPLSGTYNTFEFTGVRTLSGSSNPGTLKATALAWISDDDSGQEFGNNPATGWGTSPGCGNNFALNTGQTVAPDGTTSCGDPLFIQNGADNTTCNGNTSTTRSLRLRAIGTSSEVPAALGLKNTGGSQVNDGIGYAFWSYGNFAPAATSCATGGNGQFTTCTNLGHYLSVDSIDPLFITEGGEFDAAYGGSNFNNPNGAFNLPQCSFTALNNNFPCWKIPFTHIYDGKYPLWSLLRLVTFQNVGTGGTQTLFVPPDVVNLVANAEIQAASPTFNLSDFVPLYKNINTGVTPPTGDLNLGVFRSHFKQTNNPFNGHSTCTAFTGINITGSTHGTTNTCMVDVGGDFGGSVLPVQADVDFHTDFGGVGTNPAEIYNLRQ